MVKLAQEREVLRVIDDQIGAPTSAELLADVTAHALRQVFTQPANEQTGLSGIYHLVADGQTTWFEYANAVIAHVKRAQSAIKIVAKSVDPFLLPPTAARRPLNSRLNTDKLRNTFNLTLPHWKQGVTRMLSEFLEKQA